MSVQKFVKVALPAVAAALPLGVQAVRACTTSAGIWFWGDQALIDIEARDSLLGRNLLGVYDRYGWHHLGPIWLLLLGVFRWLGGGAPAAVVVGSCLLQVAAAMGIVVVAHRIRPGLTAWWAALVVIGFEWSFGPERLGMVWAPYAIALPAALLVLLIADVASRPNPWGPTLAAVICASFLCQTDISTIVLIAALVVVTPLLRLACHVWATTDDDGGAGGGRRRPVKGWGWSTGNWRLGAASLLTVLVVLWLPPAVQQLSMSPGNLVQVYRFMSTHAAGQTWQTSLRAVSTIFSSFPLHLGEHAGKQDADTKWLVAAPVWQRPWYVVYLLGSIVAATVALARRQRRGSAIASACVVALLAMGLSAHLVYGDLYPYLVFWAGALVVPVWVSWWLVFAPLLAGASGRGVTVLRGFRAPPRRAGAVVRLAGLAAAATVSISFASGSVPMTGVESHLARHSWEAVAASVSAPGVKTVYIDMAGADAMPEAAAIADQAMRHGRRVEVDSADLYFLDPSFAPRWKAQVEVVVCCGRRDPGRPPPGMKFRRRVGGQRIYTSVER